MRIAHLGLPAAVLCGEINVLFSDIIADIGNWMDQPGNENEIIRIYLNVSRWLNIIGQTEAGADPEFSLSVSSSERSLN